MADQEVTSPLDGILKAIVGAPDNAVAASKAYDAYTVLDESVLKNVGSQLNQKADMLAGTTKMATEIMADNEGTRQALRAAQGKRDKLYQMPAFLTNALGFFDKDWDYEYWNNQVRAGKIELADNSQQLQDIGNLAAMQSDVLNANIQAVQQQYTMMSGMIDRSLTLRQQITAEQDRRLDIGLRMQANAREVARFNREQLLNEREDQIYLTATYTDEQLANAAAGKDPKVPASYARSQMQKIEQDKLSLDQSRRAAEAGDMELAAMRRGDFLARKSLPELKALLEQSQASNGKVTIGGVAFTQREIQTELTAASANDAEAGKAITDELVASEMIKYNLGSIELQVNNAITALGGRNPKLLDLYNRGLSMTNALSKSPHVTAVQMNEVLTKTNEAVGAEIEAQVNNYPKSQQPFLRARMSGRPATTDEAVKFLGTQVINHGSMKGNSSRFAPYMKAYSAKMGELIQQAGGTTIAENEEGGIEISGGGSKQNQEQMAQQAWDAINDEAHGKWQSERDVGAYEQAIADLKQQFPWMIQIRGTHQFVDAAGQFIPASFYQYLNTAYMADVEAGKVKVGPTHGPDVARPYDEVFREYMYSTMLQNKVYETWSANLNPSDAAIATLIYNDNPLAGYTSNLQEDWGMYKDLSKRVVEQQVENARMAKAAAGMGIPIFNPEDNVKSGMDVLKEMSGGKTFPWQ